MSDAFREPMRLMVAEGAVVILGPDALAAAFTPEAAEESAQRLLEAAAEARNSRPAQTASES